MLNERTATCLWHTCMSIVIAGAVAFGGKAAWAQSIDGTAFRAKVAALYSFQPHKLTDAEITAKSGELDRFWEHVKADTTDTLPLLRQELENDQNPSFFFYDGAKLLLSLSKEPSDLRLALRSLPKADLQDIQGTDYLRTVHSLARNGLDTRRAALRVLDYPDFSAIIAQHALTLGQDYCLIYMLYAQPDESFEADLSAALSTERNPRSQRSLLLALWYLVTPSSREAIASFGGRSDVSSEVASYAKALLSRTAGFNFSPKSVASLRAERVKVMQRPISDEALMEFDALTLKLLAKS
jgi:hypothetical protein